MDEIKPPHQPESEEVAILKARAEIARSNGAMWLSAVVTFIMLTTGIAFQALGLKFEIYSIIPAEILWGIIIGPWIGKSASAFFETLEKYKK